MDAYDIGRLTDYDFELICRDIFEAELRIRLEIFAAGKDQGVDLRHMSTSSDPGIVIQCKKWERSKRAKLISHMKSEEKPKILKLRPGRYILATSVDLTKQSKDTIAKDLSPFVKTPGDIYGLKEIEAVLLSRPEIVERHIRLWLSSSAVLQAMLSRGILTRSRDLAADIEDAMRVYVPNVSYTRAQEILNDKHVCIISGLPGIGKTTLAQVLSATYVNSGYDLYEVSQDVEEINEVWNDDVPQIFYYDDFLGQTALGDRLNKNEDNRLIKIIRRIGRSPDKRLVMTTREYILEQARQQYEKLGTQDLNPLQCVLDLTDYTRLIRAEILYNHLYFSDLSQEEKSEFSDPSVYKIIIDHPNFSPRLIDYSLRLSPIESGSAEGSPAVRIKKNLDDPRRIWEHIIANQLEQSAIDILVVLLSFPDRVPISLLEFAVSSYAQKANERDWHRDFLRSLKIVENTMVRISSGVRFQTYSGGSILAASYHNPSIRDYMQDYVASDDHIVPSLLNSAIDFVQLEELWRQSGPRHAIRFLARLARVEDVSTEPNLRDRLIESSDLFVDAIIRTWESSEDGMASVFHRILSSLEIARELDSQALEKFAAEQLSTIVIYDRDNKAREYIEDEDLVPMVKALWATDSPAILTVRERIAKEIVDYVGDDTEDWDITRGAAGKLEDLSEFVPHLVDAAQGRIEERLSELAENEISRTVSQQEVPRYARESLREAIDRVESYAEYDREAYFPGYGEAKDLYEAEIEADSDLEVRSPSGAHESASDDADGSTIETMFTTFSSTLE
jgi:hypothetical protein